MHNYQNIIRLILINQFKQYIKKIIKIIFSLIFLIIIGQTIINRLFIILLLAIINLFFIIIIIFDFTYLVIFIA